MTGINIGDKIKIVSDNDTYNKWKNKTWTIDNIAYSREEHQGYDEGVGGALVSCNGLSVSLYEYEFEIVEREN